MMILDDEIKIEHEDVKAEKEFWFLPYLSGDEDDCDDSSEDEMPQLVQPPQVDYIPLQIQADFLDLLIGQLALL